LRHLYSSAWQPAGELTYVYSKTRTPDVVNTPNATHEHTSLAVGLTAPKLGEQDSHQSDSLGGCNMNKGQDRHRDREVDNDNRNTPIHQVPQVNVESFAKCRSMISNEHTVKFDEVNEE